jgi:amino acid transporter/nucleotide-binding universal stress UspA family protein
MSNSKQAEGFHVETELSRDLGLTSALAIGVGTMIAAGIFTLSGLAVRNVGSAAIAAFMLAAGAAACTALTYCEFTSIYPESGEGYLYARKTFSPPVAYFIGWALALGYVSSCAFYIASLSSYFCEFIYHTPFEETSGLIALTLLILLNIKGTKESGTFQIVVTIAKVILLLWFIAGGLPSVDTDVLVAKFDTDVAKIGVTAAMVFITFFGFSAIAASAGEVKDPVKNIPKAIFLSMGIVTVLYTLVVIVVIAAGLTEYSESAMGTAATQFLGPVGGMVIVGGALFSMISASNASVMAGSRVVLSMASLGHLPSTIGAIDPKTKTPIVAIILVGGGIGLFALMLKLEDLAHFADTVLLIALILVNIALILHRKKFPNMERPFRVPLVPLIPLLGIGANIFLLIQISHHTAPFVLALSTLVLGVLGFFAWKGAQSVEEALPGERSHVLQVEQLGQQGEYTILVPLANPATVEPMMNLAVAIAKERNGHIVALRVVQVPEQVAPCDAVIAKQRESRILEAAHHIATENGVPITSVIRVGHNIGKAVLEAARSKNCNLILLGWRGFTSTAQRILGETVDDVTRHARCDVMLMKMSDDIKFEKILFPTAGGVHARKAEDYASSIARFFKSDLTVCGITPEDADSKRVESTKRTIHEAAERLGEKNGIRISEKMLQQKSVSVGIIKESEDYDTVVIGAAGKSIHPNIMFGTIPESVAKLSKKTVIVVKYHSPVKALVGRVMSE